LQLYYRIGHSGCGDSHLAEYDPAAGGWTVLGEFISGRGPYGQSLNRNAYHNGFDFDPAGRLHTTWTWREELDNREWGTRNCHDLLYAYSDDRGRSWRNNAGEFIGATGRQSIDVASPGILVQPLPWRWGIMNQVTQAVDSRGRVHVVMWLQPPGAQAGSKDMNSWRYFHYWRDEQGRWQSRILPHFGRKPSLLIDRSDNLVLVFNKPANANYEDHFERGGPLQVCAASSAANWTDWRLVHQSKKSFVGEPRLDRHRWQDDQMLSVYAQESPAEAGSPSALHVMDFENPAGRN
jgi:hypothetical protein